jgi:hypothetical protein
MDECEAAPIPCIKECARERTYADAEDVLVLTPRTREADRDAAPAPAPTFTLPKEERYDREVDGGIGLELEPEEAALERD